jgi:predicted nucleic acid-binding protein
MALIADSGGIYAIYDVADRNHKGVQRALKAEPGAIIPVPLLSEIDYLLLKYLGIRAALAFLEDIRSGAFAVEPFTPQDLVRCSAIIDTYRDLNIALADACVVACAERLNILRILTVDQRHFRVIRTAKGRSLTLLPADA